MFSEQLIFLDMHCTTKKQAIDFLSEKLAQYGKISDARDFIKEVMRRETTDSTALGNGIAIPHGVCRSGAGVAAAVMKLKNPVAWDKQRRVRWVFLIALSGMEKPHDYLEQVGRLARLLLDDEFYGRLEAAQTSAQALSLLLSPEKMPVGSQSEGGTQTCANT